MRVSSGTRPKIPGNTRAFLQERAQKIRETLARFFRNAPKKSARRSCVSSRTRPKTPRVTCAFLQERAQKSANDSCVSSGTQRKIRRDTRAFLERKSSKISMKHVCVSSNDGSKTSIILEKNIFKKYLPEKQSKLVVLFDTFKRILLEKTTKATLFFSRVFIIQRFVTSLLSLK